MNGEAIIVLLYVRYLRRTAQVFAPNREWDTTLKYLFYFSLGLLVFELVFSIEHLTIWVWVLLEAGLVLVTYQLDIFQKARRITLGLIPFMVVLLLASLLEAISPSLLSKVSEWLGVAKTIAFTWLIAMFVLANKERKQLEKERQLRLLEEEKHRVVEEQKVELEKLVAERTQEITLQKEELEKALVELQATQKQLIQSEKMASLGELTAGIAHEIQNPLNFVNNFSEVSSELIAEMRDEMNAGNLPAALDIAADIEQNLQKITHHGKRADGIVKGMLQHSRTSTGIKEPTDINALADEYLRLSYHGLRAKDKSFSAVMKTSFDEAVGKIEVIPQDVGRVLLNLFTNAFYSVTQKRREYPGDDYQPTVTVTTQLVNRAGGKRVQIAVKDNGVGIPQAVINKIYQPFFTTKPTGEGTGLGLSLSYDIIHKMHGGTMEVKTEEGKFAEFIIELPAY